MSKQSSIDQKLCLYFIFHHPVAFRDFFIPQATGKVFYTYYYQIPPALCNELVWSGARGTGKSFDLEFSLLQIPFLNPGTESLVAAYRRMHIKDRLEKVISYISSVPYLRSFLLGDSLTSLRESVSRSPIYSIKFKNKHEISGLSTGDDQNATNLQGRHPCVYSGQGVMLANGKMLRIREIITKVKRNEEIFVRTLNLKNNQFENKKVIDGWRTPIGKYQLYRIFLEDNTSCVTTGNHKIFIEQDGKIIKKRTDKLIQNKDRVVTVEPSLSNTQRSVLIGGLLGDASAKLKLYKPYKEHFKRRNPEFVKRRFARVSFGQATFHEEYVKFKLKVLDNFVIDKIPNRHKKLHIKKGRLNRYMSSFCTRSLYEIDKIARMFCDNKEHKKKVTKKILKYIDIKALAIWFMDDGQCKKSKLGTVKFVALHTKGFTKYENYLLKKMFLKNFKLKCRVEKSGIYWLLHFPRIEAIKMLNIITPYLHPLFTYKIVNIDTNWQIIGSKLDEFYQKNNMPLSKFVKKVVPFTVKTYYVCDLSVEGNHNYIAGEMVVANCHRFLEEAQFFTTSAWAKYQNTQAPSGSVDRYYGVSHGMLDSPFYEMSYRLKKFKNKVFRVHRAMEPSWTQELKREKLNTLKGPSSNEWMQQIEAQDGEPSFGVWNEADIHQCMDFSEVPDFPGAYANEIKTITVLAKDYTDDLDPSQVLYGLPQLPEGVEEVILGIDAGYAEPTIILPFYFYKNKWNLKCKILLLDRMISDNQTELIDYIATFYKAFLGIDCTSADGRDLATKLCNPKNEEYASKQYDKRVFFIDFREAIIVGYKRVKEGGVEKLEEIKDHMKNKTTSVLRDKFNRKDFDLAHDEETIPEFISETQKNEGGRVSIHTPTDVHIPEAYRVFAGAWWKKHVVVEKPPLDEEAEDIYDYQYPKYEEAPVDLFGRKKQDNVIDEANRFRWL